jgi:hypothetical protein
VFVVPNYRWPWLPSEFKGAKFDYSVLEQSVDAIIEALVLPEYRQRYEIIDEDTPP